MTKIEALEKLRKAIELVRDVEIEYKHKTKAIKHIHEFMISIMEADND